MTALKLVHSAGERTYPRVTATERPFRIWGHMEDRSTGPLPHRCYIEEYSAHVAVFKMLILAPIGTRFEIYNARTGKQIEVYTRRVGGYSFMGSGHVKPPKN